MKESFTGRQREGWIQRERERERKAAILRDGKKTGSRGSTVLGKNFILLFQGVNRWLP
jgi:hypothetical protein